MEVLAPRSGPAREKARINPGKKNLLDQTLTNVEKGRRFWAVDIYFYKTTTKTGGNILGCSKQLCLAAA